jgi:hypothetical protein
LPEINAELILSMKAICTFTTRSIVLVALLFSYAAQGQILTHEDSLSAGLNIKSNNNTAISGYGEAFYSHDFKLETGTAQLKRVVLFVGHRFSDKITFFSELELENAVAGDSKSGEIAMEQAFIKFDLNRDHYIQAGLFIPRIGIINENHLPNTYNGNERPVLETMLIPATWREIAVGLYGNVRGITGLNYSITVLTGLDASGFSTENGIAGGRAEGAAAHARQKALTGALLYYTGPFRFQASSYIGGSVGVDNKTADRLDLSTGFFGTPVYLNEVNAQYRNNGITVKAIACMISIPEANKINTAYANNTPEQMQGAYAEAAYDLLHKRYNGSRQFHIFSRYEYINMNAKVASNGIANPYYDQQHAFIGFSYLPVRGVVIKADYHYVLSGEYNQSLIINPAPYALPYYKERQFMNIGLAYSF